MPLRIDDREMLDLDDAGRRQPHQLFDDVHQLADVARPPVALERAQRVVGERSGCRPARSTKVRRQRLDVFGPLAQRRHVQVDDAQPVQQVFAELAGGHELGSGCGWSRRSRARRRASAA